mgnify:CR=1 FL=1
MIPFGKMQINSWLFILIYFYMPYVIFLLIFKSKKFCLSRLQIITLACVLFLYCWIGAKASHITIHYRDYVGQSLRYIWKSSGFSSIGVFIVSWLTIYIYARVIRKSFLEIFDYFVLGVPLMIFFGRIACLINGCCHGSVCTLPWARVFFVHTTGNLSMHPTQAYEMIYALAIFITTLRFHDRLSNMRGAATFLVFFAYFFMRFFNESLRTDSPFIIGPLKLSHLGMITGMVLCGIGLYYVIFKKDRKQEFFNLLSEMAKMFLLCLVIIGFVILGLLTIF